MNAPSITTADYVIILDPETLAKAIAKIQLRARSIETCADNDVSEDETLITPPPRCEEYFRLAMAALEQARAYAQLAEYNRARGE